MNDAKYIGLDVHQATISAAVLDSSGKLVMKSVPKRKGTIRQFIHGLRGSLHVTFEGGTQGLLVIRPAETARHEIGGVRSSPECTAERRQQE